MESVASPGTGKRTAERPPSPAAAGASRVRAGGWVLAAAGLTLVLASILHSGVAVPLGATTLRDPFTDAAIPEAVLGVLCLAGAFAVLTRWSSAYRLATGAAALSLLGTAYGLTITVRGGRPGDVFYHVGLLALLLAAGGLLLRHELRRLLTGARRRR